VASASLASVFEYVYTKKELDYTRFLGFGGLAIEKSTQGEGDEKKIKHVLKVMENLNAKQLAILKTWAGE